MTKKRNKLEIIAKILDACRTPKSKTKIVYECNLNFHTVEPYLELLQRKKLLSAKKTEFETTNTGLKVYMQITDLIKLMGQEV